MATPSDPQNDAERYQPAKEFEPHAGDPLVDVNDSQEIWLLQFPAQPKPKPKDYQVSELKLKLKRDGKVGSFENSSGKSYDLVSYEALAPDSTVFLPTSSDSLLVGNISRRVCICRYPEPEDFEPPSFSNSKLSGLRGSGKSSSHRSTLVGGTEGTSHGSFGFPHSKDMETPQPSKKKRRDEPRSASGSSRGSRPDSHVTDTSLGSEKSHGEKSKKKKKVEE